MQSGLRRVKLPITESCQIYTTFFGFAMPLCATPSCVSTKTFLYKKVSTGQNISPILKKKKEQQENKQTQKWGVNGIDVLCREKALKNLGSSQEIRTYARAC